MKPDIEKKLNGNPNKTKELLLENGNLKKVPIELKKFTKIKRLNLFNNRFTDLPDFFNNFNCLEYLNLNNNRFVLFPENLDKCNKIKAIVLKSNNLSDLRGLENHKKTLEKLDLSSNRLSTLRVDFSDFEKLRDVDLSENQITKFPKSLISNHLKILKIAHNNLHTIPKDIKKLEKITHLDLSFNNLSELPEELGELKELRILDISGNKLHSLPKSFSRLKKLTKLVVSGNPIGDVPIEISNQGLESVLYYYLNLGESIPLNEAKLLIVGEGAVGKTYLMNKMVNGVCPETVTTEGIDIVKWNIETPNSIPSHLKLNVWDFGGQEIYHSTHQFFLTKRSVYLFIWEARKDDSLITFDYWLNIIKTLSNSSPVIIVLNKIDERTKVIDEKSINDKFPNIKSFEAVSAKEGTNLEVLKERIKELVTTLPHIGDKLPKIWSEIRDALEVMPDNYITYQAYIDICNSFGLDETQSKKLSRYFHDLGVFLHFVDNPILKHVVFLKPEWATNCVYRILDLPEVIKNNGEFTENIIESNLKGYNSKQITYVIELMKKFELCFKISNNTYVIPELLKPGEPELNIEMPNSISLIYKYDFMPAGIVSRLTVRLKDSILKKNYWKNGLYISYDNNIGKISNNQIARTLKVEVCGETKAVLLGIIRREIDSINETLNFPSHELKIQCCCNSCKDSTEPFMFDYDYLLRVKNAKLDSVQCQYSINNINLTKLIGPYEIEPELYSNDFGFNPEDLTLDLIEIASRLLERKSISQIEDLITDNFTDNLRSKNYRVTDQTRSGKSKKQSGELDIMVRNNRNMPIAIIEAFRIQSFGLGNKTIIEHINKLLINYDTNGLSRNFILCYSQASDFSNTWIKYKEYIEKLYKHHLYNEEAKLISYSEKKGLSNCSNIKVLVSTHEVNKNICEVYHLIINMRK